MGNLIDLVLLLFFVHLAPEPTSFLPAPHGIIPDYGFGFDYYGEPLTPAIVNLANKGVYKIEEEDIQWYKYGTDTSHSFYSISASSNGDSIFVYERDSAFYDGKFDRRDTEIYFKDGSMISSPILTIGKSSKIERKYNPQGKIIEKDELDDKGKIWRKTTYKYDATKNKTVISFLRLIEPTEEKYSPMKDEYKLESQKVKEVDSLRRIEKIYFYDNSLPNGNEKIYYDSHWRVIKLEDLAEDGKIILFETTKYIDGLNGRLISKSVYRDNKLRYKDEWSYDANGRCILHTNIDHRYSWKYDANGNMVEYDENLQGKPAYMNKFKLYYR